MVKRMIVTVLAMLGIIGTLGFVKFRQIQVAIAQGAAFQPPPEAVTTVVADEVSWPSTLGAIGTVRAVQGVTVSSDLPGMVERITFESGTYARTGQVLVQLDARQERAQLEAVEAERELARLDFERMRGLLEGRVISRAEYDRAVAAERGTLARVEEIRATIERKTIRAPFAGILGIRQVNQGQYLSPGDPVVSLQALNPIYVDFGLPQQSVSRIGKGRAVRITSRDVEGFELTGRVTAIDSIVDVGTRNVQVQATLANTEGVLRPGMFVQVEIAMGADRPVIPLPASAISYAPYGDSVFVVTDLQSADGLTYRGVRQQFVTVDGARGDQVAITSGLKPGDEVVTSGVFKLRNGAPVQVNNSVQPANDPSAAPENS
jgi:membrane fusion protein (multidrug efflux system)